jgi:Mg2+ and Co2+ transporter CorA
MLFEYHREHGRITSSAVEARSDRPLWVDLLKPTLEEARSVERLLDISLPSRARCKT